MGDSICYCVLGVGLVESAYSRERRYMTRDKQQETPRQISG